MSYENDNFALGYTMGQNNGYGNNGWGGMWGMEWMWIIVLFALWQNGGFGFGGGGGAMSGYATQADISRGFDNQSVMNKLNGLENGLCDGFYSSNTNTLNAFSSLTNTTNQGFAGMNTAIVSNGYENRLAINQLGYQNQQCCCDIERAIEANTVQGMQNTNSLQRQISDCCCENEKIAMQNRFDMQTYNCNTLQAIDKLGDRIIDYMNANEKQNLRDENFALKLAASQERQNNYIVSTLRPYPNPTFTVPNPFAYQGAYAYSSCGGNSCGNI